MWRADPPNLTDIIREDVRRRDERLREAADPDCRICHGTGQSKGYVGPGKTAVYACPCTGMADWQKE
jgi:hypothetical protein